MTATSQSLGIMIREARKARQWSQQRLADEINSSQSAVHRIEMGQQNVSLNMIERLAAALEMPLIPRRDRRHREFRDHRANEA